MPIAAAAPAIISAVGTIGGAALSANAQKKAAAAAGRLGTGAVDIESVQKQAREADLRNISDTNLNEDPTMKAVRKTSDEALLGSVLGDPNVENANRILSTLVSENINLNPNDANFQAKLKSEADRLLSQGGTLSPEQQAELVRSGLETSSQGGYGAGSGAGRQTIGKLLISEQERLAADRQGRARELFGFANDLNTSRIQNLSGISGASTAVAGADQNRLLNFANLVDSRKQTVGLTGGDIANLAVGNQNSANQMATNKAAMAAQNAQARATNMSSLISGLGTAAGQYLGSRKPAPTTTQIGSNLFVRDGKQFST
jgi:hypothetical protein